MTRSVRIRTSSTVAASAKAALAKQIDTPAYGLGADTEQLGERADRLEALGVHLLEDPPHAVLRAHHAAIGRCSNDRGCVHSLMMAARRCADMTLSLQFDDSGVHA